ncbi:MAG: hypothetical protein IT577_17720 [Verrucomicrobiae bacterium]|nr:hypothetical protein [Verrucomicrobiae bacterium]
MHPLDLKRLRVRPLAERKSLTSANDILIDPDARPTTLSPAASDAARECVRRIREARGRGAAVILIYGAHLLRNGAAAILGRLMDRGWLTHVATNGAGAIHDWEYAWLGRSTESVRENVATGSFGTWDETGRNIHLALMAGALDGLGFGQSMGRFIAEDGASLPGPDDLALAISSDPGHPLAPARAELLRAMREHGIGGGALRVEHRWKHASIIARAWQRGIPATVHPGIGYDIIACHPIFSGAAIGRAGELDFRLFAGSVDRLDGGVVLSIGSAIMGPQVFEKSLSCANNLRLQAGRAAVADHAIFVVDLQDGGDWDWTGGEPPKSSPAYYLRFCKSYSRMGGAMRYVQCDNAAFAHSLLRMLED